jgi:peptide/nickel transport system ATP-binding protein
MPALLQIRNLKTTFRTTRGLLPAVDDISFNLDTKEVVGLVGESGSGKSITSRSIMGLIPQPPGMVKGSIRLNGIELIGQSRRAWQRVRGERIAMVFQDPMTSLNPVYTVGEQVAETLRFHKKMTNRQALEATIELFQRVGLPNPKDNLNAYPHQLSGGMRQRVMIAMAIACSPQLLIADEPTTALDVTIQAQILDLLRELNQERDMALLLITHDLGVVAEVCQRVVVMYAGRIMEQATINEIFYSPMHPYTIGLIQSRPDIENRKERLQQIIGSPPDLTSLPLGCSFHLRCPWVRERCQVERPALREINAQHWTACHFSEEITSL